MSLESTMYFSSDSKSSVSLSFGSDLSITNDRRKPCFVNHIIYNDNKQAMYQRIQLIGQGAYGLVYLARNVETKEVCVIKESRTINIQGISPSQIREASLLQNLKHKYIVKIKQVFVTKDMDICLVFEQCWMDLKQYMKNHKYGGIDIKLIKVCLFTLNF